LHLFLQGFVVCHAFSVSRTRCHDSAVPTDEKYPEKYN
jgi:hypothetical protein